MKFHEAANIFPLLTGDEYEALKQDIKDNGQLEPIWIYDNQIIDGRNRYRACIDLEIEPIYKIVDWEVESLIGLVVSLNVKRRNLKKGQLAACAVEALPELEEEAEKRRHLYHGNQYDGALAELIPEQQTGEAREKAAELFGVNERYIGDAKNIKQEAPEIFEQLKSGELSIPEAKKAVRSAEDRQKIYNYGEPITQQELTGNYLSLGMAVVCRAIEEAAECGGNKEPIFWLLDADCRAYCEALKVPHGLIEDWIKSGCSTMPIHKKLISVLEERACYG